MHLVSFNGVMNNGNFWTELNTTFCLAVISLLIVLDIYIIRPTAATAIHCILGMRRPVNSSFGHAGRSRRLVALQFVKGRAGHVSYGVMLPPRGTTKRAYVATIGGRGFVSPSRADGGSRPTSTRLNVLIGKALGWKFYMQGP